MPRRGFVERRRDPSDRRKVVVVPVHDDGGPVAGIFDDLHRWTVQFLDGYDDTQLDLLAGFLAALNAESARRTAEISEGSAGRTPR